MFDTMTITKAGGAFCGALLVFLLSKWAAESIFHVHSDHEGVIELAALSDAVEADEEESSGEDFALLLASADPDKGERVFAKCKACHKIEDGVNGTGPHLFETIGRDIGSVDGFKYSKAMANLEGLWTEAELNQFIANPKSYLPGTKMSFAGIRKASDRANVIAYINRESAK